MGEASNKQDNEERRKETTTTSSNIKLPRSVLWDNSEMLSTHRQDYLEEISCLRKLLFHERKGETFV